MGVVNDNVVIIFCKIYCLHIANGSDYLTSFRIAAKLLFDTKYNFKNNYYKCKGMGVVLQITN